MELQQLNKEHFAYLLYCEDAAVTTWGHINVSAEGSTSNSVETALLYDLEQAGLVVNDEKPHLPKVRLTDLGWKIAAQLRRNRAEGNTGIDLTPYLPPPAKLSPVVKEAFMNICVQERADGVFTAFDVYSLHDVCWGRTAAEALSSLADVVEFDWTAKLAK